MPEPLFDEPLFDEVLFDEVLFDEVAAPAQTIFRTAPAAGVNRQFMGNTQTGSDLFKPAADQGGSDLFR